jgi:hypothetical protein
MKTNANMIVVDVNIGREIDLENNNIHKYWTVQGIVRDSVLVVEEVFDQDYDAFAVCIKPTPRGDTEWVMFYRETLKEWGVWKQIDGVCNDKIFISIALKHADARTKQIRTDIRRTKGLTKTVL